MTTRFRLAEILEKREMNQTELARLSGVHFVTVNRLSTNRGTRVDLETLDKLSAALGCQPGDLVERVERKSRKRKK